MAEKFTAKLNQIFFHPKQFFSSVEKDKDYSKIMFFYVKIVIVSVIISFLLSIFLLSIKNNLSVSAIINLLTNSIINIGFAFLIPFIASGIAHLGVLIFRGKQGYFNTYKAISYTLPIAVIYSILSTIILTLVSIIYPVSVSQETITLNPALLFQDKGFIVTLVISAIIILISLIHTLCAQVIGLSKFQKISKLRAFFAIIIIPLILFIISIIILIYLASQLAA